MKIEFPELDDVDPGDDYDGPTDPGFDEDNPPTAQCVPLPPGQKRGDE